MARVHACTIATVHDTCTIAAIHTRTIAKVHVSCPIRLMYPSPFRAGEGQGAQAIQSAKDMLVSKF